MNIEEVISRSCYKVFHGSENDNYSIVAISRQYCFDIEEYKFALLNNELDVVTIENSISDIFNKHFKGKKVEVASLEEYLNEVFEVSAVVGTWQPLTEKEK